MLKYGGRSKAKLQHEFLLVNDCKYIYVQVRTRIPVSLDLLVVDA